MKRQREVVETSSDETSSTSESSTSVSDSDMTSSSEFISLGIVGCRKYMNWNNFIKIINDYVDRIGMPDQIVSGGAKGVDSMAARYATENNIPLINHPPDWDKHGRAAGPIRNSQIVKECTHILALPSKDSIGTLDTIKKARAKNLDVTVVNI